MVPKYFTLKEKLGEEILLGKYQVGSKLPTEVELSQQYNVSRSTVRQALDLLVAEGIIAKRWGSGNTVIATGDFSNRNTIMLILPSKDYHSNSFVDELSAILLKNGFRVDFKESQNNIGLEREFLQILTREFYGGLIISPALSNMPSLNKDLLQILLKRQLPILFLGHAPEGIYNASCVSLDWYGKGYQMARAFINQGHKNLGGIFINDSKSSALCFSGYTEAIRDAGLSVYTPYFLFINSVDPKGINSRSNRVINKFLRFAYETVSMVYMDDDTIALDDSYPVSTCMLQLSKSLSRECAKAFLAIKKDGRSIAVTIPYN